VNSAKGRDPRIKLL